MFLQLLFLTYLVTITHSTDTYYATSSQMHHDFFCIRGNKTFHPCGTLESYNFSYFPESDHHKIIYLLDSNYTISRRIDWFFYNQSAITIKPWRNNSQVLINCAQYLSISCQNIQRLVIESISFQHCEEDLSPQLLYIFGSFTTVQLVRLANVTFNKIKGKVLQIKSSILDLQVVNSVFTEIEGYAIYVRSNQITNATISNCTFNNTVNGSIWFSIESRVITSSLRITNCLFSNNTSMNSVATRVISLNNLQSVTIDNSYFIKNSPHGAISIKYDSDYQCPIIRIENSTFINNSAYCCGGAIWLDGFVFRDEFVYRNRFKSHFQNCIFQKNEAVSDNGESISIVGSESNIKLINCKFEENSALRGVGGSVCIRFVHRVTVHACNFSYNRANYGGAMNVVAYSSFVEFERNNFIRNKVGNGGALTIVSYSVVINKSICLGNSATNGSGGCLYIQSGDIIIKFSSFEKNFASLGGSMFITCKNASFYDSFFNNNMVNQGNGGAVYFNGKEVNIENCTFSKNIASPGDGGAIYCVAYNITVNQSTLTSNIARSGGFIYALSKFNILYILFQSSNFSSNSAYKIGGVLHCVSNHTTILQSTFIDNSANVSGGAINGHFISLSVTSSLFMSNLANTGGAISAEGNKMELYFCNFTNNSVSPEGLGGAVQLSSDNNLMNNNKFNRNEAKFINCSFHNNTAKHGGAMYFSYSKVRLKNIQVSNNHALLNGGGIATVSSTINIDEYIGFINNTVTSTTGIGGAIYIDDQPEDCGLNSCLFSWTNTSVLEFTVNFTVTASILYGGMIDRCSIITDKSLDNALATLTKNYKDINITSAITSRAIQFCYCSNNNVNCDTKEVKRSVSLGQSFEVAIACVDQIQQPMSCVVKSAYNMTDFELDQGESSRQIHTCENLTFHIYSKETVSVELEMKSDIYCTDTMWNTLKVFVTVENCPIGFQANEKKCNCDERLQNSFKNINCKISNKSIKMNDLGWFSYESGLLRTHNNCPLNYCSQVKYYFSPVKPDVQCKDNHGGVLCGGCLNNYSIVLGSSKCMLCSHSSTRYNFIWLTIVMAIAGVALVVFLLLLKMTVSSGTINSLIFYANIVTFSGILDACKVNSVLQIFLSWINLDLGIEVCFYSGMDVYQKTWLQFVFPFYIWLLVGIVIVLCHYSTTIMKLMGMRNIEVLATLFLLSYAKLLKAIVTSLSFTDIKVAEADNFSDPLIFSRVWLFDGHLSYFSGRHLPLFIVAILFLLLLFLPYTLLLTIGHYLRSLPSHRSTRFFHSSIFTSIMDAYHAPFTKKHRYWIGLGLLVRCSLFTIFATSYNIHANIFWSIISVAILFSARLCIGVQVYQKKLVDLLEVFFLLNLLILMLTLYRELSCAAMTVSISLSFIVFGLIILYHVYFELIKYEFFHTILKSNIYSLKKNCLPTLPRIAEEEELQEPSTSYVELREPLIGL